MAGDAVSSKTIFNGSKKLIMQFTNLSDSTGESAVVKVDKSTLTGPNGLEPSSLAIDKIEGSIDGMTVTIKANHTSAITVAQLGPGARINLDYSCEGGFQTSGSGGTGDIEFTTSGQAAGSSYNLVLHMRKKD